MTFDSGIFALFIIFIFLTWPFVQGRSRNVYLLIASYVFYGAWDWRFCFLLALSTVVDFVCGLRMHGSDVPRVRRFWLMVSIISNLTILGVFKYLNFFYESTRAFLGVLGYDAPEMPLKIILPVGISFYTFQTMAYSIDVYRRKLLPTRNIIDFGLYVSFFPQLVAGPIERASKLLPQLQTRQPVYQKAYVIEGAWLVLWGFYKKVFVADNLGRYVDVIFSSSADQTAPVLMLALYAFSIQIYCDFSGYTDIARGIARILGFELSLNFNLPYFAQTPGEFWRRWHITLSEWIRDYLFIPLGGSQGSALRVMSVLIITMGLAGLWHGANWTYVLWGLYQGLLLVLYRVIPEPRLLASLPEKLRVAIRIIFWFQLWNLGWTLFRSPDLGGTITYLHSFFTGGIRVGDAIYGARVLLTFSWFVILMQFIQWKTGDLLCVFRWPWYVKAAVILLLYFSITIGGSIDGRPFIYFQF